MAERKSPVKRAVNIKEARPPITITESQRKLPSSNPLPVSLPRKIRYEIE